MLPVCMLASSSSYQACCCSSSACCSSMDAVPLGRTYGAATRKLPDLLRLLLLLLLLVLQQRGRSPPGDVRVLPTRR